MKSTPELRDKLKTLTASFARIHKLLMEVHSQFLLAETEHLHTYGAMQLHLQQLRTCVQIVILYLLHQVLVN